MGVIIAPNILHFLYLKQTKRAKHIHKVKQTKTKKIQLQTKYEQLIKDEAIAKKERAKREGYTIRILHCKPTTATTKGLLLSASIVARKDTHQHIARNVSSTKATTPQAKFSQTKLSIRRHNNNSIIRYPTMQWKLVPMTSKNGMPCHWSMMMMTTL